MSRIVDQYGSPIDVGMLRDPQTSRIQTLANPFLVPMLGGISPASIASVLRYADSGDLFHQHRLFSDMEERDAHLMAEMNKRKMALLGVSWDIVPPRNATASEKSSAAWCKEAIEDGMDDFEDLLLACMDGVGHGFAAIELAWSKVGSELLPNFHPRPQEWFQLSRDRSSIVLRDGAAGQELLPFGWILHQHGKAKTGYLGRLGLHRVLVWPFLYKSYAIGDFAEFLETYGLPMIVGKYFNGASEAEKSSLLAAVTALGHDARAIMPADMSVELMKVAATAGDQMHLSMIDWADKSVSKCLLGATLTSQADGKTSTNALGKVHDSVRHEILEADARQVAGTLTCNLVYPLLSLNRGGIDNLRRCPRLVFDVSQPEDLVSYADSLSKLAPMMEIPAIWVREKLHIPAPQEGEEVLVAKPPVLDGGATPGLSAATRAALAAQSPQVSGDGDPPPAIALADHLAIEAGDAWQAVIDHLESIVHAASSLEELQQMILTAYAGLPLADLRAVLAQGLAVAALAGIADVQEEATRARQGHAQ